VKKRRICVGLQESLGGETMNLRTIALLLLFGLCAGALSARIIFTVGNNPSDDVFAQWRATLREPAENVVIEPTWYLGR
jgi:hypothetical protein